MDLALIAIVVSAMSALAAFIALTQHARPYMTFIVTRDGLGPTNLGEPRPTADLTITNIGHAPAHNVNLTYRNLPDGESDIYWEKPLLQLGTSDPQLAYVSLATATPVKTSELLPGPSIKFRARLDLSWRQDPYFWWTHKKLLLLVCDDGRLYSRVVCRWSFPRLLASFLRTVFRRPPGIESAPREGVK